MGNCLKKLPKRKRSVSSSSSSSEGDINKTITLFQVTQALSAIDDISEESFESALESFYRTIDEVDHEKRELAKRGWTMSLSHQEEDEGSDGRGMGKHGDHKLKQRTRSVSSSPVPEFKRRKMVLEESMPWIATIIIEEESLRPELKLTLKYLKDWSIDPKYVWSSITNTASHPDFPYSEWSNIIAGRAINLDCVYSSFYTTVNDNRNVTDLGGIEITTNSGKTPSKMIKQDSKWRNTWEKTEGAYVYLMPHRLGELRKYGQHVGHIFLAVDQKHHGRVIQYDKAVRTFITSCRDILLGDYNEFADIKMHHLDNLGSGHNQTEVNSPQKSQKRSRCKEEMCHRFNNGNCPGSCGRLHACNICRDPNHIKANCTKPKTNK
jgi:hypothetical protein